MAVEACQAGRTTDLAARVRPLTRFDAKQSAVFFSRQHVEQAVGVPSDVANALLEFQQHPFAAEFLPLLIEDDTLDLTSPRDAALANQDEVLANDVSKGAQTYRKLPQPADSGHRASKILISAF